MTRIQLSKGFQRLEYLNIEAIIIDSEVASRCQLREDIVTEYANAMRQGAKFPPVIVFFNGTDFILVDGFHRIHAKKVNGDLEILASISQGNRREAILIATGINIDSSLKLTKADIRRNINKLIGDTEWSLWYDLDIAQQCCANHELVYELRVERVKKVFEQAAEANKKRSKEAVQPNELLKIGKLFDLESALNGDASSFGPLISEQFLSIWTDMVIDNHIRANQEKIARDKLQLQAFLNSTS
ncbi:hypothetical protein ACSYAD_26875 [Acaryochloris marina NIES-2412]|uniref:hypothetical protein n=1 Tax=Acaryochloris marina TaxID=155978 RepID=UPI0040595103